jgi:hypothetical protein
MPPAKKARTTVIKNDYFTNVEENGRFRREAEQLWNVSYDGRDLVIYLQAKGLNKLGFSCDDTYFGRKHLMTFAGGKSAAAGGNFLAKMNRVTGKRQTPVSSNQRRKKPENRPWNLARYAKYGIFGQNGKAANTIIFCDVLGAQALKEAFAKALIEGQNFTAFVRLPGSAVYEVADATSPPSSPWRMTRPRSWRSASTRSPARIGTSSSISGAARRRCRAEPVRRRCSASEGVSGERGCLRE